ncbi:MAG: hypothetical protein PF542_06340 [Nanoarchaeota archaeon]|jgi:hypothetical protein|nr:hypothetical protein [Nanoarchaeota archaeon]
MALFKKKAPGYVDLGKRLETQEAKLESFRSNMQPEPESRVSAPESQSSGFMGGFFGGSATASEVQSSSTSSVEDRREKLRTRIKQMSDMLEEQEKDITNLKQRLEVLERKQRAGY